MGWVGWAILAISPDGLIWAAPCRLACQPSAGQIVLGPRNELISPGPCPYFDAIVPSGVLTNFPPPYTAPIAVYVAQRTQIAAAVHRRNRAQMRPSGEIARMAHPTQPMATDRVRGRSRTRISPHPSYSGYIGGSTEFYGLQEAKIGHFGGFRRSGNRFEMR